ncbi:MAG: FIG002473: Protein YcaR in KDO2-Lipid A biosynthesis cluster, partial [uncultured Corynebacteriales bacterium]
ESRPHAAGDPGLPGRPRPAGGARGDLRAVVHLVRPRVPGAGRHPGPAAGRGAPPELRRLV